MIAENTFRLRPDDIFVMPDPRTDDSFQNYVHDADFVKLMKQIGYN